ncbi:hypothetical protein [Citrobacter portucalensis]|uniref:hypothetical protein n=1 Tax=Citrobacter portucalensis TaxID=1639133 RepID=UPI0039FC4C59
MNFISSSVMRGNDAFEVDLSVDDNRLIEYITDFDGGHARVTDGATGEINKYLVRNPCVSNNTVQLCDIETGAHIATVHGPSSTNGKDGQMKERLEIGNKIGYQLKANSSNITRLPIQTKVNKT